MNKLKNLVSRFNSKSLPTPIAPYSHASLVDHGDFSMLWTSGIIGVDKEQNLVSDKIENQTEQCLKVLSTILEENNGSLKNIIKVNIYITNMDDFSKVNEVYSKYFIDDLPARTCIEVSKLPKNAVVEIEATAAIKNV